MSPCAKAVAAVFGSLFAIALLSVPVTTTTSSDRVEPGSNVIVRTTWPRKARMFLPDYLSKRARPPEGTAVRAVRLRSAQWVATMAIVAVLGVFDHLVFCRWLLRRREPAEGPEAEPEGE